MTEFPFASFTPPLAKETYTHLNSGSGQYLPEVRESGRIDEGTLVNSVLRRKRGGGGEAQNCQLFLALIVALHTRTC